MNVGDPNAAAGGAPWLGGANPPFSKKTRTYGKKDHHEFQQISLPFRVFFKMWVVMDFHGMGNISGIFSEPLKGLEPSTC